MLLGTLSTQFTSDNDFTTLADASMTNRIDNIARRTASPPSSLNLRIPLCVSRKVHGSGHRRTIDGTIGKVAPRNLWILTPGQFLNTTVVSPRRSGYAYDNEFGWCGTDFDIGVTTSAIQQSRACWEFGSKDTIGDESALATETFGSTECHEFKAS
jgi:hypothetical protein